MMVEQKSGRTPVQADGRDGVPRPGPREGKTGGTGESAGGAYPNPHSGKEDRGQADGFDGGQTGRNDHGPGRAGDDRG